MIRTLIISTMLSALVAGPAFAIEGSAKSSVRAVKARSSGQATAKTVAPVSRKGNRVSSGKTRPKPGMQAEGIVIEERKQSR